MPNDDDQPNTWPDSAMTFYLSGYLAGIDRGRQLEADDMDRAWAPAYEAAQATARATPDTQHQAAVKARQEATGARHRAEAQPWPDEAVS